MAIAMSRLGDRRWWAIGALALTGMVVGLDTTVLNIALPTLATELRASTSALQWMADAYNLVLAAFMLPAGLLGDRYGRKRMVLAALVVFSAASVLCAYAGSPGVLIIGRGALGLGGAFLIPLTISVVRVLFDEDERPRALAVALAAQGVSFPLGPIVGGRLLHDFWWGSVFLINVPVCVAAIIGVALLLPESREPDPRPVDLLGIVLSALALSGLTYGCIEAGEKGWGSPASWAPIVAGLAAGLLFVRWERRTAHPLIDLEVFRSRAFDWGVLMATVMSFTMFGALFAMPQYFQAVMGTDAQGSGIRLLPVVVGVLAGAGPADRLVKRFGSNVTVAFGLVLLAAGMVVGTATGVDSGYLLSGTWLTVVGLGLGLVFPAAMDSALAALSAERSGIGSSLIQALRQVGATIGVAVLGTILSAGYRGRVDTAGVPAQLGDTVRKNVQAGVAVARDLRSATLLHSVRDAFVHGLVLMLAVSAGLAAVAAILALIFMPGRARTPSIGRPREVTGAAPGGQGRRG
ncbi:DHA2 family efflux MFS transporter permease subunit [Actinoallomurus acanthiterrae]